MRIVSKASLTGKRELNEDRFVIDSIETSNHKMEIYCVFDGHGNSTVSDYLYKNYVNLFKNSSVTFPLKPDKVRDIYKKLDSDIINEKLEGSGGSTCCAVFIDTNNRFINVLNTGDSRAVMGTRKLARRLSRDHKPGSYDEKYRLEKYHKMKIYQDTDDDVRVGDYAVSRSIGDIESSFITSLPELYGYSLDDTCDFIVICSDGITDVFTDERLIDFIYFNSYTKNFNLNDKNGKNVSDKICREAIKLGSRDNVTCIVIFL